MAYLYYNYDQFAHILIILVPNIYPLRHVKFQNGEDSQYLEPACGVYYHESSMSSSTGTKKIRFEMQRSICDGNGQSLTGVLNDSFCAMFPEPHCITLWCMLALG